METWHREEYVTLFHVFYIDIAQCIVPMNIKNSFLSFNIYPYI